ncbi:MAG: HNH endonuclease [Anaerolineales bacterium]|nr:HNH endonuclease [Anaerolineales bacterium]
MYGHSYDITMMEIWRWFHYTSPERDKTYSIYNICEIYADCMSRVDKEPMKLGIFVGQDFNKRQYLGDEWVFNGYIYEVKGFYSDNEIRLLILDDFDKERRYFEKLKIKFEETQEVNPSNERPRIPENVRIEVWRRDSGKCARCGSREKLEYDHIVPISKGGSNTARNIELLCEKHNRSKSNNVV